MKTKPELELFQASRQSNQEADALIAALNQTADSGADVLLAETIPSILEVEALAEELEDRDYYKEANVFWVPESARWETLRAAAKQT